jgi:hypothetical protein
MLNLCQVFIMILCIGKLRIFCHVFHCRVRTTTENYDVRCSLNYQIETMRITPKQIGCETSKDDELRDLCIKLQTEKK